MLTNAMHDDSAERWNRTRCPQDGRGPHVESYFLKSNDPDGRRALWIKATILARTSDGRMESKPVAEAWAIAFDRDAQHVAVKDVTPLSRAHFSGERLDVRVADLAIEKGRVRGSVGSGAKKIAFDLAFTEGAPPLVPFVSEKMYETKLPSSKLVSPYPDSRFDGSYTVNGETIDVRGWRGMQGHNWGTRHAELYAWSHCNQWDGEPDLVFEGFTARVKLGPILAPPLTTVCIRRRGVRYDFNAPLVIARARGHIDLRRWTFRAKNEVATVSGELFAETRDFVGLAYENPDGAITYCLNSKIARGHLRLSIDGREEVSAITRAAALEIGTKDPAHGVAVLA